MKLYIAGPMRGIRAFNFPAFFDTEMTLNGWGYETVNPARRDVDNGFTNYDTLTGDEDLTELGFNLRSALAWDLDQIATRCDGIATLPGWHKSKGAKAEVNTAIALGLPVKSVSEWIAMAREKGRAPSPSMFRSMGSTIDGDEVLALTKVLDAEIKALAEITEVPVTLISQPAPKGGEAISSIQTCEVRLVSETGGEKGQKPAQLGTVDPRALLVLAEVSGFGARKYEAFNYLKGYGWDLSFDALQRHILAFWDGEDNDPESGLPHPAHAAWHALALVSFMVRDLGTDTRFKQEAA